MNHRLEALRKAAARPGAPAPVAPSAPTGQAPAPPRPTTGALLPEDVYQAAYIDFSKGGYLLAITGFRDFLRRFPDHKLADNAQYWIGESYLALAHSYANAGQQDDKATQALEEAVREFRRVITNYPRGDKVPTAIYKEALALLDLKKPAEARTRLQYLIDTSPRRETPWRATGSPRSALDRRPPASRRLGRQIELAPGEVSSPKTQMTVMSSPGGV